MRKDDILHRHCEEHTKVVESICGCDAVVVVGVVEEHTKVVEYVM